MQQKLLLTSLGLVGYAVAQNSSSSIANTSPMSSDPSGSWSTPAWPEPSTSLAGGVSSSAASNTSSSSHAKPTAAGPGLNHGSNWTYPHFWPSHRPHVVTTTVVVTDAFTTYCPEPTTFTINDECYTATTPGYITVTNCPCTLETTLTRTTKPAKTVTEDCDETTAPAPVTTEDCDETTTTTPAYPAGTEDCDETTTSAPSITTTTEDCDETTTTPASSAPTEDCDETATTPTSPATTKDHDFEKSTTAPVVSLATTAGSDQSTSIVTVTKTGLWWDTVIETDSPAPSTSAPPTTPVTTPSPSSETNYVQSGGAAGGRLMNFSTAGGLLGMATLFVAVWL